MQTLARLALRFPLATAALLAVLSLALAAGLPRLKTEVGYRAFLGSGHPVIVELDAFLARFGGGLPLAAVWSCGASDACESVFDAVSLDMAHDVARALERTQGVSRVDSPATSPLLAPEILGLPRARRLAPLGEPEADLDALAALALDDPLWVGQLVSADGRAGAILVHLDSSDGETASRVFAALESALAPYEERGFVFWHVGGPVEFVVAGAELAEQTARMIPVMVGLVAAILLLLFRSVLAAALSLAAVGLAVVWTLGAMGWIGWPQNSLTQALAPLVLVIGVCDAIHVVASYSRRPLAGDAPRAEREAALLDVCAEVGPACLVTTLTTAAGFASFAASGLASFVRFGLTAALGVGAALALCFTLLPLLLARVPPARLSRERVRGAWERGLDAGVAFAGRRRWLVLCVAGLVTFAGGIGVTRLHVDASFEDLYGAQSRVVVWAREVASHLREPDTLELELRPAGERSPVDPHVLRVVAQLARDLQGLDGLGRPVSVLDPLAKLHRLLHRSELALEGPEASGERTAALLRLLRTQDPTGIDLLLARDAPALRLSVPAEKPPQDRLRALLAEVAALLARDLPEGWGVTVTGPLRVVQAMIDEIRHTQLASFALAGGTVLLLVGLYFRSAALALLAAVPTGLPVLWTLGAMGGLGVPLDVGTAMVAAVVLGLAVDDAVHLLARYRVHRRHAAAADAIVCAAREVGRALCTTSLALALGFSALALSPWQTIASFGLLAAIAIAAALLATLLVLPALLIALGRQRASDASTASSAS